jgi:transcriptional regulator with XRE-family HTH domain
MAGAFLGRSIRRLRQERSLTQAVLASKLGISPSYLNLIEHDERPVTASLLIKLSRLPISGWRCCPAAPRPMPCWQCAKR